MKRLNFLLALLLPLVAAAASVTSEQARTAVGNWLRTRSAPGCRLGARVEAVRTCAPTNGVAFHVARLAGGGFVVTSADTRIEPVIAFSDSDDLRETDDNPLWALLKGDLAARKRALGGASLQSVAPGGAARPTEEETRWAKLLKGGATLQSVVPVSDIRVAPLLSSKWGQGRNSMYSNRGSDCYNYYTPNNYVCGCVATALAQLMRYYRYPTNPKVVETLTCAVEGKQRSLAMKGGPYVYDNMPLVPEASSSVSWYAGGATEAQREAIGRLTYDCAVAMQMQWTVDAKGDSSAGSFGVFAFSPLIRTFGFANARAFTTAGGDLDVALRRQMLFASLDAKAPVLVSVYGHEVVADGYGYDPDDVEFTHLNMGWSGADDAWYQLPSVKGELVNYQSDIVSGLVYNVFPQKKGDVISGRVVDASGRPVAGATVRLLNTKNYQLDSVSTDEQGIYAFVREISFASQSFKVEASHGGVSVWKSPVLLSRGISPASVDLATGSYSPGGMQAGNSWGNDLVLPCPASTETSTTQVPVPYVWLDAAFPGAHGEAEYEDLAQADSDGDGFANWEEYLCGRDPTRANDLPRCTIGMVGGKPVVTHNVTVPEAAARQGWSAVLRGSDDLAEWVDVADAATSGRRFFKVVVRKR